MTNFKVNQLDIYTYKLNDLSQSLFVEVLFVTSILKQLLRTVFHPVLARLWLLDHRWCKPPFSVGHTSYQPS